MYINIKKPIQKKLQKGGALLTHVQNKDEPDLDTMPLKQTLRTIKINRFNKNTNYVNF